MWSIIWVVVQITLLTVICSVCKWNYLVTLKLFLWGDSIGHITERGFYFHPRISTLQRVYRVSHPGLDDQKSVLSDATSIPPELLLPTPSSIETAYDNCKFALIAVMVSYAINHLPYVVSSHINNCFLLVFLWLNLPTHLREVDNSDTLLVTWIVVGCQIESHQWPSGNKAVTWQHRVVDQFTVLWKPKWLPDLYSIWRHRFMDIGISVINLRQSPSCNFISSHITWKLRWDLVVRISLLFICLDSRVWL